MRVAELLEQFEKKVPFATAEEWDPVGLLIGDPKATITGVVVSVDLSREALSLALKNKANVIVNHHPCIFPKSGGLSKLVPGRSDEMSSVIFDCVREGIAVIALHTNFDQCALEVTKTITDSLGAKPIGRLIDSHAELVKLVVFVPESHAEKLRSALADAGAGHIGNYDQCTFSTPGVGRFRALDGANPFLGSVGEREMTNEMRLETVLPRGLKQRVLKAMREAHPYEEIAYDLYPIEQKPTSKGLASGLGYGFIADFDKKISFSEFSKRVKKTFELDHFLITPIKPGEIKRIGYVPGKGSSFINAALSQHCDAFITGEVGYHGAISMSRKGMTVVELGHRHSELFFSRTVSEWVRSCGLKFTLEENQTQTWV